MPKHATLLHVAMQAGIICLWAHVLSDGPTEVRYFYATGTGEEVPDDPDLYIGTVMDGNFVWHIYEVK